MDKLSKPPLVLAALRVTFPQNLRVSETRSSYYEEMKQFFPNIVFPEIKQLAYDFSDCQFQSVEGKSQLRIATSFFALETMEYKNVNEFWTVFHGAFTKFAARMAVTELVGLTAEFLNKITIDSGKVGTNFSDYFTLGIVSNSKLKREFFTLDGSIIFRIGQDLLQVEVRPVQHPQTRIYDTLDFKTMFLSNRKCAVDVGLDSIKTMFFEGHRHIEDVFRTSLTDKYWQTIK